MNGKGGSSLGTLLFSVPLAAIPLMAIFGIPQFAPLVASPERTGDFDRDSGDRSSDRRVRNERRRVDDFEDEYDDRDAPAFAGKRRPSLDRNFDDRYGRSDEPPERTSEPPASDWSQEQSADDPQSDAPRALALDEDRRERRPSSDLAEPVGTSGAQSPAEATGLTWAAAAQRFQALGITSYHLEPGADPATFLFVCSFCPAESPNVTMRFESEAADPLAAVDDVLVQINRWQQRQTAPQR